MGRAAALFAWCTRQPTGASSPHLQMGGAPAAQHPELGCVLLRAERRVRGVETCLFRSQNKCYHNSRKAFLCLSVPLGIWDNEGNVSQAWVTVCLESHVKELQLKLDPDACLVGPCWHHSAVPSPGLFPSPVPGTGVGEAATVPAPGQCTDWWGRHAENQWRGNVGLLGVP